MRSSRAFLIGALFCLIPILSCVDGDSPVGLEDLGPKASLALVPVFSTAAEGTAPLPIHLIRLTARQLPDDVVVAQTTVGAASGTNQWEVEIEVPLSEGIGVTYVLEIELINVTGGIESVQWSGRTLPMTLTPGATNEVREVTVNRGPLENLSVTALAVAGPSQVPEQTPFTLSATVTTSLTGVVPTVFWSSLDPEIASIGPDGAGVGLLPGTARLQAESGPITTIHEILVTQLPTSLLLEPGQVELTVPGAVAEFSAQVLDRSGLPIPGAGIDWVVADERIVGDLGGGRFEALAAGSTTVTATSVDDPTLSATSTIVVTLTATEIIVTPADVMLDRVGETAQLSADLFASGGVPVFGAVVTWSSGNPGSVTVSSDGLLTALADGTATIFATANGATGTATVTVDIPVDQVVVEPSAATLTAIHQEQVMTATPLDPDGTPIPGAPVNWGSSDPLVATVGGGGVVMAVADGTTVISASAKGTTGTASITVDAVVERVLMDPASLALSPGATHQLTATPVGANGFPVPTPISWASSEPLIASVSPEGMVTAVHIGTAEISATAKGVSGSVALTVTSGVTPEPSFYETPGNTELVTAGYTRPSTAHYYDPYGPLESTPGLTVTSTGFIASTQGGSVLMEADGDFSYTPPLGFEGTDQFTFTVEGGASTTVEIEVIGMVWYVGNGDGDGTSNDPLIGMGGSTLGDAGDVIYVYNEGVPIFGDIILQDNQHLLGEGYGLNIAPWGVLHPAGTTPQVTGEGNLITLANDVWVKGLDLVNAGNDGIMGFGVSNVTLEGVHIMNPSQTAVALGNPSGSWSISDLGISGAGNNGFRVDGGDAAMAVGLTTPIGIENTIGDPVRILNTTGGTLTFTGGSIQNTGGGGISLYSAQANTDFFVPITITNPVGDAFDVESSTADVHLDEFNATTDGARGIYLYDNSGVVEISSGSIQTTDAQGIYAVTAPADLTLSSVIVNNSTGGSAIQIQSAPGAVTIGLLDVNFDGLGSGWAIVLENSGTFRVTDPTSTVTVTNGQGLHISNMTMDATLSTVNVTGSPYEGMILNDVTGTLNILGGSILNAADDGIAIMDGNPTFSFGGSIVNPGGYAIYGDFVEGATLDFSGPIQSTQRGIQFEYNSGSTIRFSGSLDLQTGTNNAFYFRDGGTVEASGSGNVIATTTGQAVYLNGVDIGPGGLIFESVSADGAIVGVDLRNTGTDGGLKIMGTGAPGSGGTIQNTSGNGIYASNTSSLQLQDMNFTNTGGHSIGGTGVSDFIFDGLQITSSGFRGLALTADGEATITNTVVSGSASGSMFTNSSTSLLLDVSNSQFNGTLGSLAEGAIHFIVSGTGGLDATLTDVTATGNAGYGVRMTTADGVSAALNISSSDFGTNGNEHLILQADGSSIVDFVVNGASTFDQGAGVTLSTLGTAQIRAEVSNNLFTNLSADAVNLSTLNSSGLHTRIFDNSIDGSTTGSGILGIAEDNSTLNTWIEGNTLSNTTFAGLYLQAGAAGGSAPTGNFHVAANNVDFTGGVPPIALSQSQSAEVCVSATGNTTTSFGTDGIGVRQETGALQNYRLERFNGGSGTITDPAVVESYLDDTNPGVPYQSASVITAFEGVAHGTCTMPTAPANATNARPAAHPGAGTTNGITPVVLTLTGADPDGDALTFSIVTPPASGSLSAITPLTSTSAQVTYTPAGPGTEPFVFQVDDGSRTRSAMWVMTNTATVPNIEYTTAGNTELAAGGYAAPESPTVEDSNNVFDPAPGTTATNAGTFSSTQGGDVILVDDGSFSYIPPVGFTGDDDFPVDHAGGTATVTIHVLDMVWYVDNTATPGDGRSASPFQALLAAETASGIGETIFLHGGTGTIAFYDSGITLQAGQQLIGETAGLTIPGVGVVAPPGVTRPLIDNLAGTTINIGSAVSADNLIQSVDLLGTGGTAFGGVNDLGITQVDDVNISGASIGVSLGTSSGAVQFSNSSIDVMGTAFQVSDGLPNLYFDGSATSAGTFLTSTGNTGGTLEFTTGPFTAATGEGVLIDNSAGTVTMETLDVQVGTGRGISIANSSGTFTINDLNIASTVDDAIEILGGGPTVNIDVRPASITNTSGRVLQVQNTTGGSLTMTGGPISDNNGDGILITNTAGTVDLSNTVSITSSTRGVELTGANADVTFADLTVNTTGAEALAHSSGTGLLTVSGGSITATGSSGISVVSAPVDLDLTSVSVTSSNGDFSVVEILNSPTSSTVIGTLTLDAPANLIPLQLFDAGYFQVNGGTISSGQYPAVNITVTNLDVTLSYIGATTSTGGAGIEIDSSGGTFTATGGSIDASFAGGVALTGNLNLEFTYDGTVLSWSGPVVSASANAGAQPFIFGGPIIDNNGEGIQLAFNSSVITTFNGDLTLNSDVYLPAISVTASTFNILGTTNNISARDETSLYVIDPVGSSTVNNLVARSNIGPVLSVSGTTQSGSVALNGGILEGPGASPAIQVTSGGSEAVGLSLSGTAVTGSSSQPGLLASAATSSILDLVVDGGTGFDGFQTGIYASSTGTSTLNFDINGASVLNSGSRGVWIESTSTTGAEGYIRNSTITEFVSDGILVQASGTGLGTAVIQNNTIGTSEFSSFGIRAVSGTAAGDGANLAVSVLGNAVAAGQYGDGISIGSDFLSSLCANVQTSTITDPSGYGDTGLRVVQTGSSWFGLERFLGSPSVPAEVITHLASENPNITGFTFGQPVRAIIGAGGIQPVANGACRVPSF